MRVVESSQVPGQVRPNNLCLGLHWQSDCLGHNSLEHPQRQTLNSLVSISCVVKSTESQRVNEIYFPSSVKRTLDGISRKPEVLQVQNRIHNKRNRLPNFDNRLLPRIFQYTSVSSLTKRMIWKFCEGITNIARETANQPKDTPWGLSSLLRDALLQAVLRIVRLQLIRGH